MRTPLLAALARPPAAPDRPASRPWHFADAGLTLLRAPRTDDHGELWCRCDGGPHGFLSIAAHAHADALALEVRHDGVEILTDPGTYCYHGEPEWRRYFRSTLGHNTLELDGEDQSTSGGPFMWTRHARSRVLAAATPDSGVARWRAEHDGYARRGRPVVHRRTVELDIDERELRVLDEVVSRQHQSCRLAWHLGPSVHVELDDRCATLAWPSGRGARSAALQLPAGLSWSVHRGETDPPLGWYSPGFGRREPACTLIGSGTVGGSAAPLVTSLQFRSADESRMVRR